MQIIACFDYVKRIHSCIHVYLYNNDCNSAVHQDMQTKTYYVINVQKYASRPNIMFYDNEVYVVRFSMYEKKAFEFNERS